MMKTDPKDVLNVSLDQMHAGLQAYGAAGATKEQLELIEWLFHYGVTELNRSRSRLAGALGYHHSNIWKLFMGTYGGGLENMCETIAKVRNQAMSMVSIGFVETPVTSRIRDALEFAHTLNAMVVIRGETGRCKSRTSEVWARENNHGRTIFCTLHERMTYARFLGALAKSMSISGMNSSEGYRNAILRRLSRRNTLIIDEVGHLYDKRRPDTSGFDFIRDLHDTVHCGVVLIFTNYYWDLLASGPLSGFFEQFLGRVSYHCAIPEGRIFKQEIVAFCRAFCPEPAEAMLQEAGDIAARNDGKIRTLLQDLQHAAANAKRADEALGAKHLRKARRIREAGGDWSKLDTV